LLGWFLVELTYFVEELSKLFWGLVVLFVVAVGAGWDQVVDGVVAVAG